MKLELEDGSLKADLPTDDCEIIFRPIGPDQWCLTISEIDYYGDTEEAERFAYGVVMDAVRSGNADWVRGALEGALDKWPDPDAPEPFHIVPGGVA